jgi:rSAM/selenodomain-associated transferase 2
MKISVIMPTLNEEEALPQTLAHTAACSVDQLIVVDGGSSDHTRAIAERFQSLADPYQLPPAPRRSFVLLVSPPGRAIQMNAGAAASCGDVLVFLHADTRLPLDARRMIEQALEDSACVGGRFNVRFEPDAGWGWMISRLMNLRSRWTGIATGDQAMFVRRAEFERLGGFMEIPLMEDIEFSRRLKCAGRIAALRSTVITSYRRWHARGPLRTIVLMWSLRLLYWFGASPQTLLRVYGDVR